MGASTSTSRFTVLQVLEAWVCATVRRCFLSSMRTLVDSSSSAHRSSPSKSRRTTSTAQSASRSTASSKRSPSFSASVQSAASSAAPSSPCAFASVRQSLRERCANGVWLHDRRELTSTWRTRTGSCVHACGASPLAFLSVCSDFPDATGRLGTPMVSRGRRGDLPLTSMMRRPSPSTDFSAPPYSSTSLSTSVALWSSRAPWCSSSRRLR